MWELRSKNEFGQVEQITREGILTKQPVYDNIAPDGNGYNRAELTVQYTVEWLPERNFEAFEKAQHIDSPINPWELKNEYLTDSLGLAMRMMFLRELDEKSGKPQLYMYIKDKDGNDAEVCAEIPFDTVNLLRNMVQENINLKLNAYENAMKLMEKEIQWYKEFLKTVNAEKLFDEFTKKKMEE